MRRSAGSVVAVALTALVAGGCGGAGRSAGATSTGAAATFTRACGGCHTLTGHDTGADGGDLALGHLSVADIVSFTEVMPDRPRLSRASAIAVAEYVRAAADADRGRRPAQRTGRRPIAFSRARGT